MDPTTTDYYISGEDDIGPFPGIVMSVILFVSSIFWGLIIKTLMNNCCCKPKDLVNHKAIILRKHTFENKGRTCRCAINYWTIIKNDDGTYRKIYRYNNGISQNDYNRLDTEPRKVINIVYSKGNIRKLCKATDFDDDKINIIQYPILCGGTYMLCFSMVWATFMFGSTSFAFIGGFLGPDNIVTRIVIYVSVVIGGLLISAAITWFDYNRTVRIHENPGENKINEFNQMIQSQGTETGRTQIELNDNQKVKKNVYSLH